MALLAGAGGLALAAVLAYRYGRRELLHPLVGVSACLAHFVYVPATYLALTGPPVRAYTYAHPWWTLTRTVALCTAVYLLAVAAFHWTDAPGLTAGRRLNDVDERLVRYLGVAGFLVGLASLAYYVALNGSVARLLTVTPRTAFQTVPDTGRYRLLGYTGLFGGFAAVFAASYRRVAARTLSPWLAALLAAVAGTTLGAAVLTRARMTMLLPAAFLLVYLYAADRVDERHLAGLGAAVFAFGVSFTYLEYTVLNGGRTEMVSEAAVHTARLEVLMAVVDAVPGQYPYQRGQTFVRALLVGAEDAGLRYGDHLDLLVAGRNRPAITLSAMYVGELYLNFGAPGALVGGALYGAALKVVSQFRAASESALVRGAYPFFLVGVVALFPTNVSWALKGVALRVFAPLALAVGVAWLLGNASDR